MPDRVEVHDVTCAASVPATAPTEIAFNDAPANLRRVTIVIPDGHSGLTGIALGYGHVPIIPRTTGAFISGNDEVIHFDLSNYPIGPPWSAFVCNSDLQSHSWEIRLEYDEIVDGTPTHDVQPLTAADIYSAAANATAAA